MKIRIEVTVDIPDPVAVAMKLGCEMGQLRERLAVELAASLTDCEVLQTCVPAVRWNWRRLGSTRIPAVVKAAATNKIPVRDQIQTDSDWEWS